MEFLKKCGLELYEWASKYLWAIMLVIGAVLVAAVGIAKTGLTQETLLSAGGVAATAMLSGGVFAWLTKVAQINGVFKTELESVIYSERHALNRKDVGELWVGVTRALHNDSFKGIEDKIYAAIKSSYLPTNKDFYYENLERTVQVSVVDKAKQIIEIELSFSGILVPDKAKAVVKRLYELKVSDQGGAEDPVITCESFTLQDERIESVTGQNSADKPLAFGCCLEVKGGESVKIKDKVRFQQCLLLDSVMMFRSASYVNGMAVRIVNKSEEQLLVQHSPIGPVEFKSEFPVSGLHTLKCDNLIFAGQGVMLTFQIV